MVERGAVQVRSKNSPCDFCSPGNDDKLGRVRRLVFDRFFNRRYGKVRVCGKCFKRWYSVTLQPCVFDENVFSKNCRMGLAVKRRNCGNLLNVLQNREVGGGFGLFGGRKFECCEIKKVQCQSVCREVCPDNPCLDENTLRAKHPYVMHISLWRGDRASAKSRKEVHGTVWCSGGF